MDIQRLNTTLMRLSKRAEGNARQTLIETFVDAGPLSTLLLGTDHQVLYGRRGTGKTHALNYLASKKEESGDCAVYVDLRSIGSSGGLYGDTRYPLPERATRLLIDVVEAIHTGLLDFAVSEAEELQLQNAGPLLDRLAESISQVKVTGRVTKESADLQGSQKETKTGLSFGVEKGAPHGSYAEENSSEVVEQRFERRQEDGHEVHHVIFGSVGQAVQRLVQLWAPRRLWFLLDEWSSIPNDLQPYLADFIRRSLLPIQGVTVKLAAIEARSKFRIPVNGDYIGIELGADVAADVNLDDFMVFDNNSDRARVFFQQLLFRHFKSVADPDEFEELTTPERLIAAVFTQYPTFTEFVRAAEGVPRDAINILSFAAQRALQVSISMDHVRGAAQRWYESDKAAAVKANEDAEDLLHWIVDEVIGQRKARACLLRSNVQDPLIASLYDSRVLHILKRTISAHDQPGIRYDVYKLDFGCYVNLLSTAKSPEGLLPFDGEDGRRGFTEVPPDDYRSIRRAILDLDKFYKQV